MRWIDTLAPGFSRRAAAALLALALPTCGTVHEQGPDRNAGSAQGTSGAPPPASAPATGSSSTAPEADPGADAGADGGDDAAAAAPAPPTKKRTGELAHFYSALDGLDARTRKEHVRILWLGDSHGQADFWSGRLRTALQKRFGNGGPGFVHVAYRGYRHDGVELQIKDKWHTTPKNPATSQPTADEVFGLGGLLTSAKNPGAEASIEVLDGSLPKKLRWDLCYRFTKAGESISVTLAGGSPVTLAPAPGAAVSDHSPLLHASFLSEVAVQVQAPKNKGPRLSVTPAAGYPAFCGAVVETDPAESPGVVLDTLGINGARYTTLLAWDEDAWLTEYLRRSPQLVIFEYGTNEAGDVGVKVDAYSDKVAKAVARIRKKKPDVDCVVLAPTERADQEERSGRIRDILRDAARSNVCYFWDTIEAMGGKGSMRTWRDENPPRGAKDGIHLSVKGYQELGDKLAADLMKRF
jgi:lysophospholipase L1-like esterase